MLLKNDAVFIVNSSFARAFRILCHVKNSTASSPYSAALQNKWLTVTMSNSRSGLALSIFHSGRRLLVRVLWLGVFVRYL